MKKMLVAILRAVLILPFTAGTHGGHTGPLRLYDCSTSSVVMLSGLLAMIVVFTGSLAIPKDVISRLMTTIAFLILIVIAGMAACLLISLTLYRHRVLSVTGTPGIKSKNLQLLFLWLFVILASIYFSFHTVVQIDCIDLLSALKVTQSFLLVVFMIWETTLISVLASYTIQPLPIIRYSMRFLIAVNLSVWFNAIISEYTVHHQQSSLNQSHIFLDYRNCVQTSTTGKLFTKSWRFLSPAFVEFSLLAVTLLAEIVLLNFPNNVNDKCIHVPSENDKEKDENMIENKEEDDKDKIEHAKEEEGKSKKEKDEEEGNDEETPLLPSRNLTNSTHSLQHTSHGYTSVRVEGRSNSPISLKFTIGLSVVVCLPIFVGYLLQATVFPNNESLTLLLCWYEVAVKLLMFLAVVLGFYFTENIMSPPQVSSAAPLKTKDWIFLVSVFSMFTCHCFEMLVGYLLDKEPADAIFVSNCTSIVQDYFQTVLLLHVAKCKRNAPYRECMGFVSMCLFMTITNFGCWMVDGFIIAHSLKQTRMEVIELLEPTIWMTLASLFLPLTLYYRFASAFAFHDLYNSFIPK